MVHGRPIRRTGPADPGEPGEDERARIQERLQAMNTPVRDGTTRRIGASGQHRTPAYDGSLAQLSPLGPAGVGLETRAFFLTSDGGVLSELPCHEDAGTLSIGRAQTADIRVLDPYVHRHHAEIHWDAGKNAHMIAHGGGENGTYVNRHRVKLPLMLVGGEQIRIGKTRLIYRIRR
jgi:hypothetical protein